MRPVEGRGDAEAKKRGRAALDAIKLEVGSLLFSAQYQQRPVPLEGNLIRRAWFRYFDPATLGAPSYPSRTVQSWDVAMQTGDANDYSVCTTWRAQKNDVYLLGVFRGRLERHRPQTILIEDVGPGMNLLQDLS
jgi:phage terminase large subunit-like protein